MFEHTEIVKTKQTQKGQNLFPPFAPIDSNSPLRGNLKQIGGKYEFSFDQKLGSGLTSDAYMGINKETKKLVCVKIIDRQTFKNQSQKSLLQNQIKCQQKLQSDYIISIYDVYDTNSFCFIVTELCQDGDLFKLIQYSRYGLPEALVLRLSQNLAQALLKMKQSKIIHRDIKSQNIMLSNGIAKLGDFGFAIQEKDLKQRQDFSYGSPLYMPLQSLENNKYNYESDIFSFGVVLYQMLHCQSPWQCNDEKQLIQKIKNQAVSFKNGVSQGLQSIIRSCLQVQASKRISIQKIIEQLKLLSKQENSKTSVSSTVKQEQNQLKEVKLQN